MKRQAGFTLIEMMIVVAILGVLAAIALPSYQESVKKGRRTDAMAALQGLAQAMERHYTTTGGYTDAATGPADTGAPTIFSAKSPIDGSQTFYNLTISAATTTTYTLTADPSSGQEGDGNITLTHTGARAWDRNNDGAYAATENCWETSC